MPVKPPPTTIPKLPPLIEQIITQEQGTETLVTGTPRGERRFGMVLKRTYRVQPDGGCLLAPDEEQDIVIDDALTYERVEPPLVSPVAHDDDTAAFREATDVVVQGAAQTYDSPRAQTTVSVRFGDFAREIRVWGDRKAERLADGGIRFTDAEPFETMPVRYDKAYGGFDPVAMKRFVNPALEELKKARPQWRLDAATPFHYQRNPAGVGFLMSLDADSVAQVVVPNLDYAFDPVTPDRLAVGSPENWMAAPLPAGFDWFGGGWFPRKGYLGTAKRPKGCRLVPKEVELGWTAPDIFEIQSVLKTGTIRQEFTQAASPGMSVPDVPPGAVFEIRNMHPKREVWQFRLPAETPRVKLGLEPGTMTDLESHLNAVVVRPDIDEVVMIWCAHAPAARKYTPQQAMSMRRRIEWRAEGA